MQHTGPRPGDAVRSAASVATNTEAWQNADLCRFQTAERATGPLECAGTVAPSGRTSGFEPISGTGFTDH
eukprot:14459229-Alexandrium_andersonii.AAC.1